MEGRNKVIITIITLGLLLAASVGLAIGIVLIADAVIFIWRQL
jgi:Zn-dependent membrane protease YugP